MCTSLSFHHHVMVLFVIVGPHARLTSSLSVPCFHARDALWMISCIWLIEHCLFKVCIQRLSLYLMVRGELGPSRQTLSRHCIMYNSCTAIVYNDMPPPPPPFGPFPTPLSPSHLDWDCDTHCNTKFTYMCCNGCHSCSPGAGGIRGGRGDEIWGQELLRSLHSASDDFRHQCCRPVLQSSSPAEIAWEAVGGVTYLRPTEVAATLRAVVTATSCTDWRRQGFHLIPQVRPRGPCLPPFL